MTMFIGLCFGFGIENSLICLMFCFLNLSVLFVFFNSNIVLIMFSEVSIKCVPRN